MLNNLTDRIFLFGIRHSSDPSRLKQSIESHEMMVKAIKARDREMLLQEIERNQMSGYLYNAGVYNRTT